jgi:hypothetical protein
MKMREADIDIRLMDYYLSDTAVINKAEKVADVIELPPAKTDEQAKNAVADSPEKH